jgi:hypothetical protein
MRSHHGTIWLAPLDRSQVRDMVTELSARHALPQEVVEDVAARTGGVPLFVEEVTRLLLERGGEQGGIHAIPPTLQQSLTARLDRLGSAREVAQIGAVIGRDFSYKLLREIAGIGMRRCKPRWNGPPTLRSCWCRGFHPRQTIASSTRSFRTRPTRICLRAVVRLCTAVRLRFQRCDDEGCCLAYWATLRV